MRIGRFFFNLLFPPKCISCHSLYQRDILDPCEAPFCEKCRLEWEKEKTAVCANCGKELLRCDCSTGRLEKAGIATSLKLVFYQGERDSVGKRSVLYLKRNRNRRAFDFFAEQLSFPIKRYLREKGIDEDKALFCYVPRAHKSAEAYGLDQADRLCRALSRRLGIPFAPLFCRSGVGSADQKTLTARERERNAQALFCVNERLLPILNEIACVILVDDVITTGASVSACARLLKNRYSGEIVAVSLARTPLARKRMPKRM